MSGTVTAATPQAMVLLRQLAEIQEVPAPAPKGLWRALEAVPPGQAVEWRPPTGAHRVLGCTRYRSGDHYLLLMNEISDKHVELSRRLHRQRLEATGRLVASIAHELRNSVSSIVYSADFLSLACSDLPPETVRETAHEMVTASRRLQFTVDGLLDYARLGPTVSVPVSLREVLTRAQGFLRAVYSKGQRRVQVDICPEADWVRGNSLTIEQIFVNLLLNAAEASRDRLTVVITSERAELTAADGTTRKGIRVRVSDNGPGVRDSISDSIFQPFVTTRENGTGLGLTNAREAAESLGGALVLERARPGACFSVYLPRGEAE